MSYDKDIQINDLPLLLKEIASEIGLENTIKFTKLMGGMPLYVPHYEKICVGARNRAIISEYKQGRSIAELARKYGLTTRSVRNIVQKSK